MTKGKLFEKAWRLGFKGDFHLVDEIYHPDYKAIDHRFGIETNIDSDKAIVSTFSNNIKIGPFRTIYESEKFLCIHRYSKLLERENLCVAIINAVTYIDSKIITQESVVEYLDYDPSENQDWNWEDYEWLGKVMGCAIAELKCIKVVRRHWRYGTSVLGELQGSVSIAVSSLAVWGRFAWDSSTTGCLYNLSQVMLPKHSGSYH